MIQHQIKRVHLSRFEGNDKYTCGQLTIEHATWNTIERGWQDNNPGVSCVPPGEYICTLYNSPEHHETVFKLDDVTNRTYIEIHVANTPSELLGCIAIGKEFGQLNNEHAVLKSRVAFDEFMKFMGKAAFLLTIEDLVPDRFL